MARNKLVSGRGVARTAGTNQLKTSHKLWLQRIIRRGIDMVEKILGLGAYVGS